MIPDTFYSDYRRIKNNCCFFPRKCKLLSIGQEEVFQLQQNILLLLVVTLYTSGFNFEWNLLVCNRQFKDLLLTRISHFFSYITVVKNKNENKTRKTTLQVVAFSITYTWFDYYFIMDTVNLTNSHKSNIFVPF